MTMSSAWWPRPWQTPPAENLKAQAAQEAAEGPEDLSDTAEFPPAPQAEEEPEEEPVHGTRRIDFGNLQFGRDYEIK